MSQMQSPKQKKTARPVNTIESLKADLFEGVGKDIANQLFGDRFVPSERRISGEILPQEQIGIDSILNGDREKEALIDKQIALERQLHQEENSLREKRGQELKLALHALIQELQVLGKADVELSQQVQIAAIQAPADPGTYHVFFFQRLVEYVKGHRVKAQEAAVWLKAVNARSSKKSFWGQYKISGGRRLMSSEDYSQRSAG